MLAYQKPVLYVGSAADEGAQLLKHCGLLVGCAQTSVDLYEILKDLIEKKRAGFEFVHPNENVIKEYSFEVQGSTFVKYIEEALQ